MEWARGSAAARLWEFPPRQSFMLQVSVQYKRRRRAVTDNQGGNGDTHRHTRLSATQQSWIITHA